MSCFDQTIQKELLQNGYVIKEIIGKGGFAECYKIFSMKYKQDFACKVITLRDEKRDLMTKSFRSEYDALTTLSHPNIVQVYDAIYTNEHIYLILEYCPQGDLQKYIKKNGPLDKYQLSMYIYSIVNALAYLESKNFSHNDIKPSNILIDAYGRPKLADFGLSKKVDTNSLSEEYTGTLLYLAPEILMKKSYNPTKADIWSFGIMLYYLATSTFPFEEITIKGLKKMAKTGYYHIPTTIDPVYRNIIAMCLIVKPEDRVRFCEIKEYLMRMKDSTKIHLTSNGYKLSHMKKNKSTTTSTILTLKAICPRRISRTPKPQLVTTFSDCG